jgi:2-oxoglutarate ferredoxin oxidoreductase subunit beta
MSETSEMTAQTTKTTRAAKAAEKPRILFERPRALTNVVTNYCPGCSHGIVQRLVAQTIDELGIEGTTVGVCPVGCSVTACDFYACDMVQAAHGRAPAVATGLKRACSENVVLTYQGDGDLASIGMAETVHAATRGEKITVIFINNAIYGMTGGQMAPTSLPGQITQTSPYGRDVKAAGHPIRVCELLSTLDGVALAQRVTVDNPKNVRAAKRAIKKGFQYQIEGLGFSIIEVLSTCPTNWGLTPANAFAWLEENMIPYYPLGVYRDVKAEAKAKGSGGEARS